MFENEIGCDILTTCNKCGEEVISTLYGTYGIPMEEFIQPKKREILIIHGRCPCGGDVKWPPAVRGSKVAH